MLGAEDVKKYQTETPPQVETEIKETLPSDNLNLDSVVLRTQIGQQLGLASLEVEKYSGEIESIVEWARSNGAKTMEDILYEIRYLSGNLASNPMEKKIRTVARYVFLSNEKQRLNKEMERLRTYE